MRLSKKTALGLISILMLTACNNAANQTIAAPAQPQNASNSFKEATSIFTVYKSPTCGCCQTWINHLEQQGLKTVIDHPADLNSIKKQYQIAQEVRSCHTTISEEGYVFEGHVPARYIKQFLRNPPADALGLAVPSMPLGSPGMEVGDKFMPYKVLLLKENGTYSTFIEVNTATQQYE